MLILLILVAGIFWIGSSRPRRDVAVSPPATSAIDDAIAGTDRRLMAPTAPAAPVAMPTPVAAPPAPAPAPTVPTGIAQRQPSARTSAKAPARPAAQTVIHVGTTPPDDQLEVTQAIADATQRSLEGGASTEWQARRQTGTISVGKAVQTAKGSCRQAVSAISNNGSKLVSAPHRWCRSEGSDSWHPAD